MKALMLLLQITLVLLGLPIFLLGFIVNQIQNSFVDGYDARELLTDACERVSE